MKVPVVQMTCVQHHQWCRCLAYSTSDADDLRTAPVIQMPCVQHQWCRCLAYSISSADDLRTLQSVFLMPWDLATSAFIYNNYNYNTRITNKIVCFRIIYNSAQGSNIQKSLNQGEREWSIKWAVSQCSAVRWWSEAWAVSPRWLSRHMLQQASPDHRHGPGQHPWTQTHKEHSTQDRKAVIKLL